MIKLLLSLLILLLLAINQDQRYIKKYYNKIKLIIKEIQMDNLNKYLSEIINEGIETQVFPENKELKFEYYTTKNKEGKKTIKGVTVTYNNDIGTEKKIEKKATYPDINSIPPGKKHSITDMIKKGALIAQYLSLDENKDDIPDIVVKNGDIISISGYTLEKPYNIFQVDSPWILEKKKQLDSLKKKISKE
jgi:uncharacterized protein YlaN (UPF0358 family)